MIHQIVFTVNENFLKGFVFPGSVVPFLPQVADANTPQQMDAAGGECSLYHESMRSVKFKIFKF
jgi:hypothetical protein